LAERRAPIPKPEVRKKTKNVYRNRKPKKKRVPTPTPVGKKVCVKDGCKKKNNLSIHHVYHGSDKRDNSSLNMCVEWCCWSHHQSSIGIHGTHSDGKLDKALKKKLQRRLESEGMSREEFRVLFGTSYL